MQTYLSLIQGGEVANLSLTSTPSGESVTTLSVSLNSGSAADVREHLEAVVFVGATSVERCRLRVARGDLSGSTLQVEEFSDARFPLQSGDTISIRDEVRIRSVLPGDDDDLLPDGRVTYTGQTEHHPPRVCSGGHQAKWASGSSADFDFDGSQSSSEDPTDGGALTHAWDFGPLATPTSSAVASPTGVSFPVGTHTVRHTVTDTGNGSSAVQVVMIRVHDPTDPPTDVLDNVSLTGDLEGGWSTTVRVAPGVEVTEGQWAVLMGDTRQFFVGVVDEVTTTRRFGEEVAEVRLVDPLEYTRRLRAFSKYLKETTSPTSWFEMRDAGVRTVLNMVTRFYSTLAHVVDVVPDLTDRAYSPLVLQANSLYEQLRVLLDTTDAIPTVNTRGQLLAIEPYGHTRLASRGGVPVVPLTDDDLIEVSLSRRTGLEVGLFLLAGVSAAGGGHLSRWPGAAPAGGSGYQSAENVIVGGQADANTRAGLRGGRLFGFNQEDDDLRSIHTLKARCVFGNKDVDLGRTVYTYDGRTYELSRYQLSLGRGDVPILNLTLKEGAYGKPGKTQDKTAVEGLEEAGDTIIVPPISIVGPPGPPGPPGVDGQDGQDGQDGLDGADGQDAGSGVGTDNSLLFTQVERFRAGGTAVTGVQKSLLGIGLGTRVVPPNRLKVGTTFIIEVWGYWRIVAGATCHWRLIFGNVLAHTFAFTPNGPITNHLFHLRVVVTINSRGVSGTAWAQGELNLWSSSGVEHRPLRNNFTGIINTTIANEFDITTEFGAVASTSNYVNSTNVTINQYNFGDGQNPFEANYDFDNNNTMTLIEYDQQDGTPYGTLSLTGTGKTDNGFQWTTADSAPIMTWLTFDLGLSVDVEELSFDVYADWTGGTIGTFGPRPIEIAMHIGDTSYDGNGIRNPPATDDTYAGWISNHNLGECGAGFSETDHNTTNLGTVLGDGRGQWFSVSRTVAPVTARYVTIFIRNRANVSQSGIAIDVRIDNIKVVGKI